MSMEEDDLQEEFDNGMVEAYFQMQETARDIIDVLKAGDTEEAILRLERDFFPKWGSVDHSRSDYQAAIEEAVGKPAAKVA